MREKTGRFVGVLHLMGFKVSRTFFDVKDFLLDGTFDGS